MNKVIRIKPKRTASPKKRTSRKTRFTRVALTALAIAGVLFITGAVIGKAVKPYLVGYGENREIAQITDQIAQEEAQRRDLKRQIRHVQTPAGMEAEARKLGWVKEGEVAVVVEGPAVEPTSETSPKSQFLHRIGNGIVGLFSFGKTK
jgi:cell division protein FtsL